MACLALLVFLILQLLPAGFFYEPLQVAGQCEIGNRTGQPADTKRRQDTALHQRLSGAV